MTQKHLSIGVALLALAGACQQASEELDAKRMPKPPPPPASAEIPAFAGIAVSIDGKDAAPIDAARLGAVSPTFHDEERRAWLLGDLLGAAATREGAVIAVSGPTGPEVLLRPSAGEKEPQPVLLLSRRGEPVATLVSPDAPFPKFHGMGGRLGRSGDPIPRVEGVTKIRVYVERTESLSAPKTP